MANKIGLFIPCYIDQYYPNVAIATLEILEQLNYDVFYNPTSTCCGQPFANSGLEDESVPYLRKFSESYDQVDLVIVPSGSCVLHIHERIHRVKELDRKTDWSKKVLELSDFLNLYHLNYISDLKLNKKLGIIQSCHGLRGLNTGQSSEYGKKNSGAMINILKKIEGLQVIDIERPDECCGFGGTFSVNEPHISVAMGMDRLHYYKEAGCDLVTGTDISCMMHLQGLADKNNLAMKFVHFSELLVAARKPESL